MASAGAETAAVPVDPEDQDAPESPGAAAEWGPELGPRESVYRVARRLKRADSTLFSALRSILRDSAFVAEIRALWPSLPLLPNLRCGLWYQDPAAWGPPGGGGGACWFKSTDGHTGNWSFSATRLNLSTAFLAAQHGGCLVVDATRRGKLFPDSMTRTIPIWCCVLNSALLRLRQQEAGAAEGPSAAAAQTLAGLSSPDGRPQRGANTHSQESTGAQHQREGDNQGTQSGKVQRSDSGVKTGQAQSQGDTAGLRVLNKAQAPNWDCELHVPPRWVSATEKASILARVPVWVDALLAVAPREELVALARQLERPLRPLWVSQRSVIWTNHVPEPRVLSFTPLVLISASDPSAAPRSAADQRLHTGPAEPQEDGQAGQDSNADGSPERGKDPQEGAGDADEEGGWVYIPGAGDDEESWARGLTPHLFWAHKREILRAGPYGCRAEVARIVESDRVRRMQRREVPPQLVLSSWGQPQQTPHAPTAEQSTTRETMRQVEGRSVGRGTDPGEERISSAWHCEHIPSSAACRPEPGRGLWPIAGTRLRVCSADALPEAMSVGDAARRVGVGAVLACAVDVGCGEKCRAGPLHVDGTSASSKEEDGHCYARSTGSCIAPEASRVPYLFLPIQNCKKERLSLLQHLPAAVKFATDFLQSHPSDELLIVCPDGSDISVSVALAVLFQAASQGEAAKDYKWRISSSQRNAAGELAWADAPKASATTDAKRGVRVCLALVSAAVPHARPARGHLKQVSMFVQGSTGVKHSDTPAAPSAGEEEYETCLRHAND